MIVEERDYKVRHGQLKTFLDAYEEHGLPVQQRHLGTFLGYFTTEIGELHHVVAWWSYDGLGDRETRRGVMEADPAWAAFLKATAGMLDTMNTRILRPVSFSPLR